MNSFAVPSIFGGTFRVRRRVIAQSIFPGTPYISGRVRLVHTLIDDNVGPESRNGKPEDVGMGDGPELLSAQLALYRFAQDAPDASGLVVDDFLSVTPESQLPAVQMRVEHARGSDVSGLAYSPLIEGRKRPGFVEDR